MMIGIFELFLSFIRSIFFNFKMFPLKIAFKLPLFIKYNTYTNCNRNQIKINCVPKFGLIRMGYRGSNGVHSYSRGSLIIHNGQVVFNGRCVLAQGFSIRVDKGKISFGDQTSFNKNSLFLVRNDIIIGNKVITGWNVTFQDYDGHTIINHITNTVKNEGKPIEVGNHIWIASDVKILKGSKISDNSVVSCNSVITKRFENSNCLIINNSIKQRNIDWLDDVPLLLCTRPTIRRRNVPG